MTESPVDQQAPKGEADEVRAGIQGRAARGVLALVVRGASVRVLMFGGWLVIAGIVGPSDFGLLTFGLGVVGAGAILSEGGIAAGLIRRVDECSAPELRAACGFQTGLSLLLTISCAAVALPLGEAAISTLVMVASLPVAALKTPAIVVAERALTFRPIVIADLIQTVVLFGIALPAAILGVGLPWIASAVPFSSAAGVLVLWALVPAGRRLPTWRVGPMRGVIRFGAQYQAVGLVELIRDQTLAAGLLSIGGAQVTGQWGLAFRVLQVPFLLFQALWRVSFSAIARLRDAGADISGMPRRVAVASGVLTAVLVIPLISAGPGTVGLALGDSWREAGLTLPWGAAGLAVAGPVSVGAAGYLYAIGRARGILVSTSVASAVFLTVALLLISRLGSVGAGIGWMAGSLCEAVLLSRLCARAGGGSLLRVVARPAAVGIVGGVVGLAFASIVGIDRPMGIVGALVVGLVFSAGLGFLLLRREIAGTAALVRLSLSQR